MNNNLTMNKNLIIKEVNFNGANLIAVQNNDKIYVGVSYICNGIGFSKSQKDTQVQNIQKDYVLNRGCLKFQAGVFDPNNETLAIEINFLPLWLAKINVTPNMKEENDELHQQYGQDYPTIVDRLIEYQLKAKDVLAKAFLPDENIILQDYLQLDEDERAIIYFQERKQRKQIEQQKLLLEEKTKELEPKAKSFEKLISATNNQTMNQVAKSFKTGRNRLFKFLREKDILMDGNLPYQQYIEQKLFVVREYSVPIGDEIVNKTQTLVTAKGLEFIDKLLKEVNYDLDKRKDLLQKQAKKNAS